MLLSSSYDARRKLPSKEEEARDMRLPGISAGDQSSSAARYQRPEDAVGGSSDPAGVQGLDHSPGIRLGRADCDARGGDHGRTAVLLSNCCVPRGTWMMTSSLDTGPSKVWGLRVCVSAGTYIHRHIVIQSESYARHLFDL